jgi:hypothetical protein
VSDISGLTLEPESDEESDDEPPFAHDRSVFISCSCPTSSRAGSVIDDLLRYGVVGAFGPVPPSASSWYEHPSRRRIMLRKGTAHYKNDQALWQSFCSCPRDFPLDPFLAMEYAPL